MCFYSIENILVMKDKAIEFEIRERLAVGKYKAGKALGWGRRATDAAIKAGAMPIIAGPKPTVPTSWLRQQLRLKGSDEAA
jgi:hypothetical protein